MSKGRDRVSDLVDAFADKGDSFRAARCDYGSLEDAIAADLDALTAAREAAGQLPDKLDACGAEMHVKELNAILAALR